MTLATWDEVGLGMAVEFLDSQRRPVRVGDRAAMRGHYPYYGASGVVDHVNGYLFDEDLILLGEDGENILSRVVPLAFKISGKSWVNNHAHVLRPKPGFDTDFLVAFLESLDYSGLNSGTAQPKLNMQSCLAIKVLKPPLIEQRLIARFLLDIDDLIEEINMAISKKRAIKQGMMQELLTGRTRLRGFEGEWGSTTLGSVCRIKTGARNNQDKVPNGAYPFFVRSATVERIDSYSYDTEAILVPGEGGIGTIFHYIKGRFEVHQRVYKISDFASNVSGKFVYYFMRVFFGSHAMENSVKATVDSLRLPTFKSFELRLPPTRAEQEAIVEVLEDADAEIEALERRLEATRQIKEGMMQELLTGRTRLV